MKFVNPATLPLLTTAPEHMVNALRRNEEFWLDHEADFEKKFTVWLSK